MELVCSEFELAPDELIYFSTNDAEDAVTLDVLMSAVRAIKGDGDENYSSSINDNANIYDYRDTRVLVIEELSETAIIIPRSKRQKFDRLISSQI